MRSLSLVAFVTLGAAAGCPTDTTPGPTDGGLDGSSSGAVTAGPPTTASPDDGGPDDTADSTSSATTRGTSVGDTDGDGTTEADSAELGTDSTDNDAEATASGTNVSFSGTTDGGTTDGGTTDGGTTDGGTTDGGTTDGGTTDGGTTDGGTTDGGTTDSSTNDSSTNDSGSSGGCVGAQGPDNSGTVALVSTMAAESLISEDMITGAIGQISFGDGGPGDADGLYDITDPTMPFGSLDLFPAEDAFVVGSLTYDPLLVCESGQSVVPVDSWDLSGLWEADSATTDISDVALQLWFFGQANELTFGALPAGATVTFTDGAPTSIDVSVSATFTTDVAGLALDPVWSGTLTLAGDTLSLQIDDTVDVATPFGTVASNMVFDLTGTVDALQP